SLPADGRGGRRFARRARLWLGGADRCAALAERLDGAGRGAGLGRSDRDPSSGAAGGGSPGVGGRLGARIRSEAGRGAGISALTTRRGLRSVQVPALLPRQRHLSGWPDTAPTG